MSPRQRRRSGQRLTNWWDIWPDLYNDEIDAFDKKGIPYKVQFKNKGILILEVQWPVDELKSLSLSVGFSPLHPFARPAIAAPNDTFERHQDPFGKNLCLLTQESRQWDSRQKVADFIDERIKVFFLALESRRKGQWQTAAELEENAADPLMPYFAHACREGSVIMFDSQMGLPTGHGTMSIARWQRSRVDDRRFEAVLQQLNTSSGKPIGRPFRFARNPEGEQSIEARWVRLDGLPITTDPAALMAAAEAEIVKQQILQPHSRARLAAIASQPYSITGLVFAEETSYGQSNRGPGWLFIESREAPGPRKSGSRELALIRGVRASEQDVFARLPVALSLRTKSALVVGCGAIGSFVAAELARAGIGELTLLDDDQVEPGNSLRWPLGRSAWGESKVDALSAFLGRDYPWVKVSKVRGRVGLAIASLEQLPSGLRDSPGPAAAIYEIVEDADVVVDATASSEAQDALAYLCHTSGTGYVMGSATEGLAGGLVASFPARSQACLACLREHWNERALPKPRSGPAGTVAPVGCNQPTFVGGGFDLQEVSLEAVRTCIDLLTAGNGGGEPLLAILELRNAQGERKRPQWWEGTIPRHPSCSCLAA